METKTQQEDFTFEEKGSCNGCMDYKALWDKTFYMLNKATDLT